MKNPKGSYLSVSRESCFYDFNVAGDSVPALLDVIMQGIAPLWLNLSDGGLRSVGKGCVFYFGQCWRLMVNSELRSFCCLFLAGYNAV